MIAEIQVLPTPAGTPDRRWAHVEAAIDVIEGSGLQYEVGPLGTSIEGPPDRVWQTLRQAHEATLAAGAAGVITVLKVEQSADPARQLTIEDLVGKYRSGR
jgi:uncharacterized protein YqgV (UPF0045/DUF77 family)